MGLATFWALFSRTHLVILFWAHFFTCAKCINLGPKWAGLHFGRFFSQTRLATLVSSRQFFDVQPSSVLAKQSKLPTAGANPFPEFDCGIDQYLMDGWVLKNPWL
jgi:hypothetical protein